MSAEGETVIEEPVYSDNKIDDANNGAYSSNDFDNDDYVATTPIRPLGPSTNEEHGVNADDVKSMVFETWEEAESFYCAYSKQMGFNVRRRDCRKSTKGNVLMYRWVCSKEGVRHHSYVNNPDRKRRPRAETRERCQAMFQVNFSRERGNFFVKYFSPEHNHDLLPISQVRLLSSRRCVRDIDQMDVNTPRKVRVKTSQIVDHIDHPEFTNEMVEMVRYGSLMTKCTSICQLASKSNEGFQLLNNELDRLANALQELQPVSGKTMGDLPHAEVHDPMVLKNPTTNIQHKRKSSARRCGNCHDVGHIRTNCPHQSVDVHSSIQISPVWCESEILGHVAVGDEGGSSKMDMHPLTSSQPTQWETHASLSEDAG